MTETEVLKRAALIDCLAHSTVLGPVALGGSIFAAAFALALDSPWPWLVGLGCFALGGVAAAWRLLTRHGTLVNKHRATAEQQALAAHERELDQLHERLSNDDNPQTQAFLVDLRRCQQLVHELRDQSQSDPISQTIISDLDALLKAGLHALHTLANLWDEINALATYEAQEPLWQRRRELVTEMKLSVTTIVEQVQSLQERQEEFAAKSGATRPASQPQDLAQLRQQLAANLAVAQRVDERISSFENEIQGTSSSSPTTPTQNN
jgi:hypothetical protein